MKKTILFIFLLFTIIHEQFTEDERIMKIMDNGRTFIGYDVKEKVNNAKGIVIRISSYKGLLLQKR